MDVTPGTRLPFRVPVGRDYRAKRSGFSRALGAAAAVAAVLAWGPRAEAQMPVAWQGASGSGPRQVDAPRDSDAHPTHGAREAWTLSIEGVTHAPVDWGVMLGLETPPGLRLSAGVGWVPGSYMTLLTGIAASASGNTYARALLERGDYEGRTWRVQAGFRPFRALGLYGDVGYARVTASGALDLETSGVAMLAALGGGYRAETTLDMWLVELGYQGQLAQRLVLGVGLGAMATFDATTTLAAVDGAPENGAIMRSIATSTDAALEKYGIVPTLTLRLGFDLI